MLLLYTNLLPQKIGAHSPTEREIQCFFFIGFYVRGNAQKEITKVELRSRKLDKIPSFCIIEKY